MKGERSSLLSLQALATDTPGACGRRDGSGGDLPPRQTTALQKSQL